MGILRLPFLVLAWAGVAAYAAAALVTVADVVARRFGAAVPGVVDLVQLFTLSGTWLVMPWAFLSGAHVAVDLLTARLSERARRNVARAGSLAALLLLVPMLWTAWDTYLLQTRFGDVSQQIGIPIAWYWRPLLFGLAASLLAATAALLAPGAAEGEARPE